MSLVVISSTVTANDDYDLRDYVEIAAITARCAKDILASIHLAKNLTAEDMQNAIVSSNEIFWDIIVPVSVAAYATSKCNVGSNTPTRVTAKTVTAISTGLIAYILATLPKSAIKALVLKSMNIRKSLEFNTAEHE